MIRKKVGKTARRAEREKMDRYRRPVRRPDRYKARGDKINDDQAWCDTPMRDRGRMYVNQDDPQEEGVCGICALCTIIAIISLHVYMGNISSCIAFLKESRY